MPNNDTAVVHRKVDITAIVTALSLACGGLYWLIGLEKKIELNNAEIHHISKIVETNDEYYFNENRQLDDRLIRLEARIEAMNKREKR